MLDRNAAMVIASAAQAVVEIVSVAAAAVKTVSAVAAVLADARILAGAAGVAISAAAGAANDNRYFNFGRGSGRKTAKHFSWNRSRCEFYWSKTTRTCSGF